MKGVVLAGGEGTRLRELSGGRNKHTVEVAGSPMITYPLRTLGDIGCDDVVIVTSPEGERDISTIVGDGSEFELGVSYAVQQSPLGTADALSKVQGRVEGVFPLICGDVYLDPTPDRADRPTLFFNEYEFGDRHTVWVPETDELIEKPDPKLNLGRRAIVFYFYDDEVFSIIPTITESARGELELEDLHRFYRHQRSAEIVEHRGFFGDMGTPDGLARVEGYIQNGQA